MAIIFQVIVDIFLVVILVARPFQKVRKVITARALVTLPFWAIWSIISSGIALAIIVFFEELFVTVPLLMLSLGKPRKTTSYLALGLFLILGIGSYLVMIILVL
jgi:hypothetical protein